MWFYVSDIVLVSQYLHRSRRVEWFSFTWVSAGEVVMTVSRKSRTRHGYTVRQITWYLPWHMFRWYVLHVWPVAIRPQSDVNHWMNAFTCRFRPTAINHFTIIVEPPSHLARRTVYRPRHLTTIVFPPHQWRTNVYKFRYKVRHGIITFRSHYT